MSGTAANVDNLMYNISLNSGSETENPFGTRHIVSAETNTSNTPTLDRRITEDDSENPDEAADKARLIGQVLELQNTLEDLSQRVDSVKEENLKLQSENQVLGKYIDNLMSTSSVFQQAGAKKGK